MHIERLSSPHFVPGRSGERPRGIVLHTNVGSFDSTVHWFMNADSNVSAHYLVGRDGRVAQFVNEADTARHAGNVVRPTAKLVSSRNPNLYTIGIEFVDDGDPFGADRTNEQYTRGAELIRRMADRWAIPLDREHVIGHREIRADKGCPGNLDIERLVREARSTAPQHVKNGAIVCLLPVRNGAEDLPGYLAAVERFADAVIALDDGSTDATGMLLREHPLVHTLLANPRRSGYCGWHDGANRNRLLAAAEALRPAWTVFLDVDERVPTDDASALVEFLASDALPGIAYGFQSYRMWHTSFDSRYTYVYRLFAFRPGLRVADEALHSNPVPTTIPQSALVRTTLRIQHIGAVSEQRRVARLEKYRQVDPRSDHPTNFGWLSDIPAGRALQHWEPRPPGLPVLVPR